MVDSSSHADHHWLHRLGLGLLILGLLMVLASFLPLEGTRNQQWTPQDAKEYDRLSLAYHESAYQTAARAGRTEEEMQAYRAELKRKFEEKQHQLTLAQEQPQRWSRFLLWTGCVLTGAGYFLSTR